MAITERLHSASSLRAWRGAMPVEHLYTYGVAGERFFRELKDKRTLVAAYCDGCRQLHLPPKMYCERCFARLDESSWRRIESVGEVASFTVLHVGSGGRRLEEPIIVALIKFPGVSGGLIHKLGGLSQGQLKIGLRVQPVFERRRQGSILDIKHFVPA